MRNILKKFRSGMAAVPLLAATLLVLAFGSCEKDPEVSGLTRNTDELSFAYNKSTQTFSVRNNGPWSVSSDAEWLSFSPAEGVGDGTSYQYVYVTAAHNTGDVRKTVIELRSPNSTLEIAVQQNAGIFEIGMPAISGALRINAAARATLDIPYTKASGGERIRVTARISGEAAAGIELPAYETTIDQEGDGTVSAPFSGTPAAMGEVTIDVQIYIGGELVRESQISTSVMDETTLLLMTGSKFKWGGYYLEEQPGVKSNRNFEITAEDDNAENYDTYMVACNYGDAGSVDLFATNAAYQAGLSAFRTARGLKDWTGAKVYEHPGYIKMGTGSVGGWIQTPALEGLEGTANITVEFEFFRWKNDTGEVNVLATDGGTVIGGTLPTTTHEWIKMSCIVRDATSATKIRWSAANLSTSGSRFTLRNIVISQAKALKEPLATPANIQSAATDNSLTFSWDGVLNATGYRVTLADAAHPQFTIAETVLDTQYTFEQLDENTEYLFTVQALYEDNPAFDSPVSDPVPAKTLSNTPSLPAPIVKLFKSERGQLVFEWTADKDVQSQRIFNIELRSASGDVLRRYERVTYTDQWHANRFTFGKTALSTDYTCAVQFVSASPADLKDSEWGTCTVTSAAAPDMSRVVFYEDFNDMWMAGDYANVSFGAGPAYLGTSLALKNFETAKDNFVEEAAVFSPEKNATDVFNPTTANAAYRETYWSAWSEDWAKLAVNAATLPYNTKIYPCCGCVKYGTSSANGVLTLPALTALGSATDVTLTFKAHPYVIPNSSTGSLEGSTSEGLNVTVAIYSGAGSITGADADGKVVLTNLTPAQAGADAAGTFIFTEHTVRITNADATTRILIASGKEAKYVASKNRIWLDDIKVVR